MNPTILSPGDIYGFAALLLIGVTAILMLSRSTLLKRSKGKNLNLLRRVHIAVATLAGGFLILHVTYLFTPPASIGIIIGYVSVGVAIIVWVTGTAFLEKVRDSLFFHGSMTSVLVALALIHADVVSPNIPADWAQIMLGVTVLVVMANASFHLLRAVNKG
jgi:hypothetical protein